MTTFAATSRRRQTIPAATRSPRTRPAAEGRLDGRGPVAAVVAARVAQLPFGSSGVPSGLGASHDIAPARRNVRAGVRVVAGSHATRAPETAVAQLVAQLVAPRVGELGQKRRPQDATVPGQRFAGLRARRALEVTGSCIMLLGFLALAIFG